MAMSNYGVSVPRLKGRENYDEWAFAAENFLILEGMQKCITHEAESRMHAAEDAKAKAKYELQVRGMSDGTMAAKRELVREAFEEERLGLREPLTLSPINPEGELATCEERLETLKKELGDFDIGNKRNEFVRIRSRLVQLQFRLDRTATARNPVLEIERVRLLKINSKLLTSITTTTNTKDLWNKMIR